MKKLMAISMVFALATTMLLSMGSAKAGDRSASPVIRSADDQGSPVEPEPTEQAQSPQIQEPQPQQEPAPEQDQPAPEQQAPLPEPRY